MIARVTEAPRKARLKPARRDRLADQAHDAIRAAIMSGEFAMGERLTETQLAGDLSMSRAPVREALQRLAKEGLVVEQPHQGTFVAELTAADVVDFYNVRLGIETTAVRLFIQAGADTAPLRRRIAEMARAAERDDLDAVVRSEVAFHRDVCEASGNAVLVKLFAELEGRLMLVVGLDDRGFERLHDVASEHEPVVEAIERADPAAAAAAMEEHILSTVGDLVQKLGGEPGDLLLPLRPKAAARKG